MSSMNFKIFDFENKMLVWFLNSGLIHDPDCFFFPKVYVTVEVRFHMYYPRLPHSTLNMAT